MLLNSEKVTDKKLKSYKKMLLTNAKLEYKRLVSWKFEDEASDDDDEYNDNELFFAEDQARYIVALDPLLVSGFKKKAKENNIAIFKVGVVIKDKIKIASTLEEAEIIELKKLNEEFLAKKFS